MENENLELNSYYDMAYLDDENTQHLARLTSKSEVDFYSERFTILNCSFVNT